MSLSIGELVGYVDLDAGPAEKAADKIGGMFDKLGGSWGKVLGGAGVAAGAAFATSLVGAMNLEPSRDRVAAALDLTKDQAKIAGEVSGNLYAEAWGESAEEVDGAVEAVMSSIRGMRQASEKELHHTTQSALTFATAMQVDVVRAAQVAGNMVSNGLAKNGVEAFDLLTKAASKVPVQLREDILDAADEYGQFFHTLGISGPEAMALLANGAKKGMYGIDKAGDAIKEFTIRSTDMSALSKSAYQTIGVDAHQMASDILAGGDKAHGAFEKIVSGILAIKDPATRSNTAIALFGTQMEDLGVKDVPKFLKSLQSGEKGLGKWKGATDKAGKTLNDNARTNLTQFTRSLKMGFIDMLGGKVLPKVTEWTAALNTGLGPALSVVGDVLKDVTGFLSEHQTVAATLVGIIVALTAVTAAHAAVLAVSAAGGLAQYLMQTKLVSAATKVWAAVQWAMNAAMSANPLTLIVLGIIGLIAVIVLAYKHSETFRKIVSAAFGAVKGAASATWGWIKGHWPLLLAILTGPFGLAVYTIVKHWSSIKSGASDAVHWITSKLGSLVGFIKGMPGKIGKGAAGMFDSLPSAARSAFNAVAGLWNDTVGALSFHVPGWVPKIGGKGWDVPNIPELATGGRATAATLAVIGEGREPESVLPDSVLRGLLERAHNAGMAQAQGGDRNAPLIGQVVQQPGESADTLAERLWFKTQTRG